MGALNAKTIILCIFVVFICFCHATEEQNGFIILRMIVENKHAISELKHNLTLTSDSEKKLQGRVTGLKSENELLQKKVKNVEGKLKLEIEANKKLQAKMKPIEGNLSSINDKEDGNTKQLQRTIEGLLTFHKVGKVVGSLPRNLPADIFVTKVGESVKTLFQRLDEQCSSHWSESYVCRKKQIDDDTFWKGRIPSFNRSEYVEWRKAKQNVDPKKGVVGHWSLGCNAAGGFCDGWHILCCASLPLRCTGEDEGCCTYDTPCDVDEGDCDNEGECKGSLTCGHHNCPWGDLKGTPDDCCVAPQCLERTTSGPNVGECCAFPFEYKGKSHYSCTHESHDQLWCSTTHKYQGMWGNCPGLNGDYRCSFLIGDGVGGSEVKIGKQRGISCIDACVDLKKRDDSINGVTVYSDTNRGGCWCERNMTKRDSSIHMYKSGFLANMCPSTHPYVYYNGRYCCKYNKEKYNKPQGDKCDGSTISFSSLCCKNDAAVRCNYAECVNYKSALPTSCPKERGWCVQSNGKFPSTGVIKLNNLNGDTAQRQTQCLQLCRAHHGATGCQVIWNQQNRGCYVFTVKLVKGSGNAQHACWVFSKCI